MSFLSTAWADIIILGTRLQPVNSILDWDDNLAGIFEAILTFMLMFVFVDAVDALFCSRISSSQN